MNQAMKTPLLLLALAASVPHVAMAQNSSRVANDPAPLGSAKLEIAPPHAVDHSVSKLAGRPVHGTNGERLGTIKDFVVDKKTGEVVYAVVSSGGLLGAGDTLRLVPLQALRPAADGSAGFVVNINRVTWDQTPALIQEAFGAGLVIVSDDQRRSLSRAYGVSLPAHAPAVASRPSGDRATELAASPWIRASALRDKDITASGQEIGEIEDIVIDLRSRKAVALVELEDDVLRRETDVLIPLTELSLHADTSRGIATTLTRNDFVQLDPAARQRRDAAVLPTGRTAAAPAQPLNSAEATLASAARSARQALDAHTELSRADIRVAAESGMLVLRGRVRSEQLKDRAEAAVKDAASGIRLQNYLVVDPR